MTDRSTAEMVQVTLAFLQRADLKGGEVGSFVTVCEWLQGLLIPPAPTVGEEKEENDGAGSD